MHFFGGAKCDRKTVATDHRMIDLSNTSAGWVRKASLPLGGDHLSHAVVNGQIYAIGGEHGHGTRLNDGAQYVQHKYVFSYNLRRTSGPARRTYPSPAATSKLPPTSSTARSSSSAAFSPAATRTPRL